MAKLTTSIALTLSYLVARVAAHGAVTSYVIGGTTYPGYTGFSPASSPATIELQWPDYNPILDPSDAKIVCNGGTSAALTATVAAGSTVTAKWAQWTHREGSITVYLKKCASFPCTPSGSGWFKIDEAGLLSGTMYSGVWGAGKVLDAGAWTSTIPASLAPGNYLIRHELIAVHQSNTPQFYPECAQLVITGSGSASPSGSYVVSIPGYAKLSDANVRFDIYAESAKTVTSWDVPGPDVWTGSNSAPGPGLPATTSDVFVTSTRPVSGSVIATTPAPPVTTIAPPATTIAPPATSTPGAALYGQCGGQNWSGPTTCASGTCKVSNEYYSQCLP